MDLVPSVHTRLTDFVSHWVATTPEAPAWAFAGRSATYAELAEDVRRTAKALLAAGIRRGDRVAMLTTPRPEYWQTFLACASIGAVWIGLNPRYQPREVSHVITDSKPTVLVVLELPERPGLADEVAAIGCEVGVQSTFRFGSDAEQWQAFIDRGLETSDEALREAQDAVTGDDPVLIVYTSGTTGKPKGAVLSHHGMCASFRIQAARHSLSSFRAIANLPINHIGGVGDLCCTPLAAGGLIVFQESFDPHAVFDAIEQHHITALMQVPTMLKILAEHPRFKSTDLSSLEAVHWGGGALPLHVIRQWRQVTDGLGVTYGLTEITGSVTYSDSDATDEQLSDTVGRPVPEIDFRLVDADGNEVPPGEKGEVQVRHPGTLLEYFGNAAATAGAFTEDGFLSTGDVAVMQADGNLRLVGRMKEMYKSGGYNVYPREVELVLETHPHVRMAAVVAMSDPTFDQVGQAWVEVERVDAPSVEELRTWCRERMANYKVPKSFRVVTALPLLPVGKVDKKRLQLEGAAGLGATTTQPAHGRRRDQPSEGATV